MDLERIEMGEGEFRDFVSIRDQINEPVSFEQAGFTPEQIERLNRRGLVFHTADKPLGTEDEEAHVFLAVVPDTPAARMTVDAHGRPEEEAAKISLLFIADARIEEDDETFRSRWIQYY